MRSERTKIESEQKQEAREKAPGRELPKTEHELMEESQKEVISFKNEGRERLSSIEEDSVSAGVQIDNEDVMELNKLNQDAVNAREELKSFSKRYDPSGRKEVASKIWQFRREVRKNKLQAEKETVEKNNKREDFSKEEETLSRQIERTKKSLIILENRIQEQKNK